MCINKDESGNTTVYSMDGYDYATKYLRKDEVVKVYESTMKAIIECYKEYIQNIKETLGE